VPVLVLIVAVVLLLVLGWWIVGLVFNLLWWALLGLVIGALARLVLPGRQTIGWLGTAAAGIAGDDAILSAAAPIIADGHVVLPVTAGVGDAMDMTSVRFTNVGPVPSRLGIVRSAATTVYGNAATIYGVVRSTADNGRTPGVPVTLYARNTGTTTWRAVAKATTDSTGVATFKHWPTVGTSYYTQSSRTMQVHASTSELTSVAVAPSLTTPVASACGSSAAWIVTGCAPTRSAMRAVPAL